MRRPFAGTGAEVMVDATGINGGATVKVYDSETGGTQLTDLQATDGSPIVGGVLRAGDNGKVPRFLGPDDGRAVVWLDAGFGRLMAQATDTPARAAALEQTAVRVADDDTLIRPDGTPISVGAAAQLNNRGAYVPGTAYAVADGFSYEGVRYAVTEAFTGGFAPDLAKVFVLGVDPAVTLQALVGETEVSFPYEKDGVAGFTTVPGTWSAAPAATFDEDDVTNEWGHATVPHTKTTWPATVGAVNASFFADAAKLETAYDASAFGGKGGFHLDNDAFAAVLPADVDLDTNPGWGAAYVVMGDWGINDLETDGTERLVLALEQVTTHVPSVRVKFRLINPSGTKTYSWVIQVQGHADVVVPVGSLPGLDAAAQHVFAPTSVAILTKGSASYLSVNGAQVGGTFDLSGLVARWINLNPHSGENSTTRGDGDYWGFGWTTSGFPSAAVAEAWVADRLAAAAA